MERAEHDRRELPAEIEAVRHRDVHALPGLGAVGVAGVAGDEHPRHGGARITRRDIVETVGETLTDLVHRPPGHLFHVEGVRV